MAADTNKQSLKGIVFLGAGIGATIIGFVLLMAAVWEPNWYGRYVDNTFNIPENYSLPPWLPYLFIPALLLLSAGLVLILIFTRT